jgi:hypothetical protein
MKFIFPLQQPGGRRNTLFQMGTLIGKTLWFPKNSGRINAASPFRSPARHPAFLVPVSCGSALIRFS